MFKHHEESIERLVQYFIKREGVIAIILGGSVAKGAERPDSDIDAMVVLDTRAYEQHVKNNQTVEIVRGECTYDQGYFDVKYIDKAFLIAAAERASEPTRNSFVKSRVLYSSDIEIENLVASIGRYPKEEKQDKIISFMGYLGVDSYYFWVEAERANDLFMKVKCAGNIVHFGLRLILAHNELLFPCARGLVSAVRHAAEKPENILQLANEFLTRLDTPSKDAFVTSILTFTDWGVSIETDFNLIHSRYTDNNEQWWLKQCPLVAEW